ncbi:mitosis inhibitor protein kinase swe1 [Coemansia sp. RSA 552]|nr:mitosis inhibitor protein kinase swe1 [Coemansia sp. RSA 552]
MAETPAPSRRMGGRGVPRRTHTAQGDSFATPAPHPHALRRNNGAQNHRRRTLPPTLRSYKSFPALATVEPVETSKQRSENINHRPLLLATRTDCAAETPTPAERRLVRSDSSSLLGCLTPTKGSDALRRPMSGLQSLSPSPSPSSPLCGARQRLSRAHERRLSFNPAEMAGSVARNSGIHGTMFTPPATKLVRPDPSAFASTGLQSKKQQARMRSSSSSTPFVAPETPCKRMEASGLDEGRLASGVMTPNHASAPKPQIDDDPFRLGKHRNPSTGSLRRTRKRPHLGPVTEDDDMAAVFDTPCRPRQNTLVDDDDAGVCGSMGRLPPPDFRIPQPPLPPLGGDGRALPPSFALEHQQEWQTLAAKKLLDPETVAWDTRRGPSNRWSWTAASDTGSVSSASTLAPNQPLSPRARGKQRVGLAAAGMRKPSGSSLFDACTRGADSMDMDMDDDDQASGSTGAPDDEDDVFGSSGSSRASLQSPRMAALEQPQLPQVTNGCWTNYPHSLRRDYFFRARPALEFLQPGPECRVDEHGYQNHLEQHFDILEHFDEGHFSSVFSVRSLENGQLYAVKRTRSPYAGKLERGKKLREVEILWRVAQHPGVVRLVDAWEQDGHLYMQLELCEGGSLAGYLDRCAQVEERIDEQRVWAILAHAAHSVGLLHSLDILHLDVKPENFLLDALFDETCSSAVGDGWLKLGDFGHAVQTEAGEAPRVGVEEGDRKYMAPEVLRSRPTPMADVFSLGMMMLEIVADIVLPDNGVEWHKLREACFDDPNFVDLPYSAYLLDAIKQMLHPDPRERPTMQQVLNLCYSSLPQQVDSPLDDTAADEDDDGEEFVSLQRGPATANPSLTRHSSFSHHGFGATARTARPTLTRANTATASLTAEPLKSHPMLTRSAAKAASPPPTQQQHQQQRRPRRGGLSRRAASAPGTHI